MEGMFSDGMFSEGMIRDELFTDWDWVWLGICSFAHRSFTQISQTNKQM